VNGLNVWAVTQSVIVARNQMAIGSASELATCLALEKPVAHSNTDLAMF
jgi:hypothetical protein